MTDLKTDLASLKLDEALQRPRRRWIPMLVVALVVAGAVALWRGSTLAGAMVDATDVVVEQRTPGELKTPLLTASGYVVARRKAVVSAKIQGRLAELRVEEGSRVAANAVIARLESADFDAQVRRARAQVQQADAQVTAAQASIRRAEADLAESRRQVAVNERLSKEQILATDTLDASRSRVQVLEAALGQAQAELTRSEASRQQASEDLRYADALLANTVIRAPFAGIVVRKMAEVGESVAPIPPGVNLSTSSGAIVALADLDTLEVEVDVAEANVAKLGSAQPAEVTVEAFPDKKYRAELRQVIPTADRTKATVMVKVTILDRDPNLKPEMSAKATFLEVASSSTGPTRVVLVPTEALVTGDDGSAVFRIIDGQVKRVSVATGPPNGSRVVITKGLAGGERIVLTPPDALRDGDRVTVTASPKG